MRPSNIKKSRDRRGADLSAPTKVRLLTNIGYAEYKRGNFDAAMRDHTEALALAEQLQYTTSLAYIYFNLGIMQAEKQNTTAALDYLNRALRHYQDLGQKNGVLQVLNAIGTTYYKTGNFAQSRKYLQRAVVLGKQINSPDQLTTSYEALYAMYEKTGPLALAYQYLKLYSAAKDSLINSVESKKIAELAIENATIASEQEIELLKKGKMISDLNLERQKYRTNVNIVVIVLLFGVIALMYFYLRSVRRGKRLVEETNASLKRVNLELEEKIGEVKALSGLLPICSSCKKIRGDKGCWEQLEGYISRHSEATFSHGICPECMKELYPAYLKRNDAE